MAIAIGSTSNIGSCMCLQALQNKNTNSLPREMRSVGELAVHMMDDHFKGTRENYNRFEVSVKEKVERHIVDSANGQVNPQEAIGMRSVVEELIRASCGVSNMSSTDDGLDPDHFIQRAESIFLFLDRQLRHLSTEE